ncbi:protein CASP [Eurytemora carolleeae]|uniref:protein CASP n=1 Tax=Eurytemora carolleeae TaxID=1294199 RepID=UPI000C792E15|nr:protein CASP [Eurytemora carolleeae]|eukprot:XP_023340323.1 protein CASP-like [Eurytemora affinis]
MIYLLLSDVKMASKLQSLTTVWQDFDLTGTQKLLDDLAGQITVRQDESDLSRKGLIDMIRSFKKTNTEETRLLIAPLLKSFQNEVDSLSKRSKAAEKAFFDIYQKFCDIADPVPTLEFCMESMKGLHKVQDLEIENGQLRETLNLTSLEVTRLKMKEKELEQLQEKMEEMEKDTERNMETKVEKFKEKINIEFNEKIKLIEEEQLMYQNKMADAENKSRNAFLQLEEAQAELYELKYKQDNTRSALSDEMEMLLTDVERANQRAAAAEREVLTLQERLEGFRIESNSAEVESVDSVNDKDSWIQLAAKEREVSQLVEDLQRTNKTLTDVETKYTSKVNELECRLGVLETEKIELQDRLEKQKDYHQIKKDLGILKTLEFSNQDNSVEKMEDNRPLEVLILERSKVLQSENSILRLDRERIARELQDLKSELDARSAQCSKQTDLIAQLEDHVEQLQTISTPYREEAEGRSSSDMLAEVLQDSGDETFFKESSLSPVPGTPEAGTLLGIVQAQRERLRAANEELELNNEQQRSQLHAIQGELQHLKQDNIKLYEKIRYLQSCSGIKSGQSTLVPGESKYHSSYEQRLDPFTSFNQAEKQRKYAQLTVFEKIILSLVRFIAGNKTARLAVFFYAVVLHGLVFAVLYKLALTDSCRHDMAARWHEKYLDHMQEVHGDADHEEVG